MKHKENLIPFESIRATDSTDHRIWRYGMNNWNDFFSERQERSVMT